ncbi:MAG: DivIVA domain-containing protein [Gemmatimonadota bacterium]
MELTPIDLKKQEFPRAFRGYDPLQVRRFLDEVADAWETLIRGQEELRQRSLELGDTIENYRRMERTLNETLLAAQRIAEESRETSLREAEIIRKEAEMEGRRAVERAETEARGLKEQIRELRLERDNLFRRLRDVVEEELLRLHALKDEHAGAAERVPRSSVAELALPDAHAAAGESLAGAGERRGVLPPPPGARDVLDRPRGLDAPASAPRAEHAWPGANGEARYAE